MNTINLSSITYSSSKNKFYCCLGHTVNPNWRFHAENFVKIRPVLYLYCLFYFIWCICCGSICYQLFTFIQICFGHTVLEICEIFLFSSFKLKGSVEYFKQQWNGFWVCASNLSPLCVIVSDQGRRKVWKSGVPVLFGGHNLPPWSR